MGNGFGLKPLLHNITSSLKPIESKNTTKNTQETLEILKADQLARELQDQAKYLESQNTEMRVSKDALSKYPTMEGIPTLLMYVLTSIVIGYSGYEGSKYILSNQTDKGPQQEEVVNGTQENIQHAFVIDTAAIIDYHKETLSKDELEEFEGFSKEKQWEHSQDNKK